MASLQQVGTFLHLEKVKNWIVTILVRVNYLCIYIYTYIFLCFLIHLFLHVHVHTYKYIYILYVYIQYIFCMSNHRQSHFLRLKAPGLHPSAKERTKLLNRNLASFGRQESRTPFNMWSYIPGPRPSKGCHMVPEFTIRYLGFDWHPAWKVLVHIFTYLI